MGYFLNDVDWLWLLQRHLVPWLLPFPDWIAAVWHDGSWGGQRWNVLKVPTHYALRCVRSYHKRRLWPVMAAAALGQRWKSKPLGYHGPKTVILLFSTWICPYVNYVNGWLLEQWVGCSQCIQCPAPVRMMHGRLISLECINSYRWLNADQFANVLSSSLYVCARCSVGYSLLPNYSYDSGV